MPAQPHPYLARKARFTDGDEHPVRRDALPPVHGLEDAAHQRAATLATERVDVVPIARAVPVAVLGHALGVGDVTAEVGTLCDAGTVVADRLPGIAIASLLFQCRDATATLVANAFADGLPVELATSVVLARRVGDVWVLLDGAPFGGGANACPGQEHALALARGIIRAFANHVVVERGPYEPRTNIQMPSRAVRERR